MTGATLLAIFKAIPALQKIFEEAVELYYKELAARDQDRVVQTQKEREALVAALKQPGLNDENRRILRRRLYDLHRL